MSSIVGLKTYGGVPYLFSEISINGNIYNDEIMGNIKSQSSINELNKILSAHGWKIQNGGQDGVIFENTKKLS